MDATGGTNTDTKQRLGVSGWGPDRKRGAVSFTFDNLGEAADLEFGTWPKDKPVGSHYTVVNVIPELLRRIKGMSATFFTEAWNAETYPDTLRAMVAHGHEVGIHGWRHEIWSRLDNGSQTSILNRCVTAMQRIGLTPRGFRPPGGAGSPNVPTLLRQNGLTYVSEVGEADALDEGIVRLPFAWRGVDGVFLQPELGKALGLSTGEDGSATGVDAVLENFSTAILNARQNGGHAILIFHPWLLGQDPQRIEALMTLVNLALSDNELWVASCGQVAEWLLADAT